MRRPGLIQGGTEWRIHQQQPSLLVKIDARKAQERGRLSLIIKIRRGMLVWLKVMRWPWVFDCMSCSLPVTIIINNKHSLIHRAGIMQDTQWWWMGRSTTSTFSPVGSLTPKAYLLLVKASISIIYRDALLFKYLPSLAFSLHLLGNGVVIHLPGLFEEGDKNDKKGIFSRNE